MLFWLGGITLLIVFLYAVQAILLPFIVGILLAYFLDPAADKLEEWRFSRGWATITVLIMFSLITLLFILLFIPLFMDQVLTFADKIPGYVETFRTVYLPKIQSYLQSFDTQYVGKAEKALSDMSGKLISGTTAFVATILQSGTAFLNLLSLLFVTPIVAFYLLRDWDRMTAKIDSLLPREHAPVIREQMQRIDDTLAGWIRGQTTVCVLLGLFYAIGLSLVGLNFGFAIGLLTGIFSFIPYIGMMFGMVVGLGVAFFQFDSLWSVAMVLGVFALGQFLEGNFVTPKLVGDKVGLHPVWVIFGMLAGGALFGFVGILLALPVTAIIGVLVRFLLDRYRHSSLYEGHPATSTGEAR